MAGGLASAGVPIVNCEKCGLVLVQNLPWVVRQAGTLDLIGFCSVECLPVWVEARRLIALVEERS